MADPSESTTFADPPFATYRSDELHRKALPLIPGGVNSNVRLSAPATFFERAHGARLHDVDGNDYVDYVLGQGPSFLGHAHPAVNAAVAEACSRGMVFGGQHPLEVEAAELTLDALGWADQMRLGMTGTECVQAALRAARAATGRRRFVRFRGHYHGWVDNVLIDDGGGVASAGQLAASLAEASSSSGTTRRPRPTLLSEHGETVAAVIMEPIMINTGSIEPRPGYLERVRELCTQHGCVLIFDEVITGFRLALGGAAERFGVVPDLATYGKAMAGGWPVAALAGRADLMGPSRHGRGQSLRHLQRLSDGRRRRRRDARRSWPNRAVRTGRRLRPELIDALATAGEKRLPLRCRACRWPSHRRSASPEPVPMRPRLRHRDLADTAAAGG